jgi:structural maintenance of chromosome 2|tara:strand:- start:18 stop:239 length:222 start_codon:yes stop_codon:yes gene_type:complete
MFDKAESEFKALQEKRRIVLNDRSKIESVIHELDEKKKEALQVTWEKVNADFGRYGPFPLSTFHLPGWLPTQD